MQRRLGFSQPDTHSIGDAARTALVRRGFREQRHFRFCAKRKRRRIAANNGERSGNTVERAVSYRRGSVGQHLGG
jgi:hypothetical protein